MRRGEIDDSVERQQLARAFVVGVLQQDAKNAYDRILKATNSSPKNATARNALKKSVEKMELAIEKARERNDHLEIQRLEDERNIALRYELAFDEFVKGWRPLEQLRNSLQDLPKLIEAKLYQEAVAIMSGHVALVEKWKNEHEEWLSAKRKWESQAENILYLNLRPRFEAFEVSAGGKITKRRGRWHLYLDWLRANPELAGWRGGESTVNPLSEKALQRINKARPLKKRAVEAEEFWKANPELQALDKLHGFYEREFVRRRKAKRNSDGFDHRPTFTLPNAITHPRWLVFSKPETNPPGYRNLQLPSEANRQGRLELHLVTGDKPNADHKYPSEWVPIAFRADPRLARFRQTQVTKTVNRGKAKGESKLSNAFEFFDRHINGWRQGAEISGVKLMFRRIRLNEDGTFKSGVPYLVFTSSVDDLPLTPRAKKIEWTETGQTTKSGKVRKRKKLPEGLVVCAVDLGLRHVGFATLCVYENGVPRVLRSRSIWLSPEKGGPDLAHIGRHKRKIRRLRQLRGKPVKGENSHVELQDHITHMSEDRFKKAARAIINFAWNADQAYSKKDGEVYPRADVIILEKLEGFIPDAEKERGINRSLAAWNRGQLVTRLKEVAVDAGYKGRVFEVMPHGTSQVCSRCGALGRRYSIRRHEETRQLDVQFGWVEKLFACPKCGYRANADHNASLNLHRKFLDDNVFNNYFEWTRKPSAEKQQIIDTIELELLEPLRKLHEISAGTIETPF